MTNSTPLLPLKKKLKVVKFNTCNKLDQQQFIKIGLIPGAHFMLIRAAPLGDPIEIFIRNTRIALSKAMLQKLHIEPLSV